MATPVAPASGHLRRLRRTLEGATRSRLARVAAASLALRVFALCSVFACHLLLARTLGAHAYGLYAYALAWMKALDVPSTLGLERLIVREVAFCRAHSDWASWRGLLAWAERTLLFASAAIAFVAVIASWFIARGYSGLRVFWLAMALLPLTALLRLRQFALQGMHLALAGQIPEALVQPLVLLALVAVYSARAENLTAAGAMVLNVVAACASLVCAAALLRRALPAAVRESEPTARPRGWVRSVLPMLLVSGVQAVSSQIPVLMLGLLGTTEAAGVMAVAKRLSDLTIIPTLALSAILTPTLATLWAKRDTTALQRTITKCARGITLVSLPLALSLIVFGRQLLEVFGARFAAGVTALAVLCAGQIINMLTGSIGLLLVMTGHERRVAFISTACALLNVSLCALLIPRLEMLGAALGSMISLVVWNLWLAWSGWRLLRIRPTAFARLKS